MQEAQSSSSQLPAQVQAQTQATTSNKSFYKEVAKYKFNQKVYNSLEKIHSITGIHPKYIEFVIDKRTNEPLFSLHYTFFINKLKELGLLKSYSITLEVQGSLVKCVFKCTYRSSEKSSDYENFIYELYDQIQSDIPSSNKSDSEYSSKNIKRQIIMLQKSTVMNAIKFLFPNIYMEYNIFNKGNLGVWNQLLKTPTYSTKNEGNTAPPPKTESSNQPKNSEAKNELAEKYRKEFIKLRESSGLDKEEFSKVVSKAKYNLKIESPSTELDYQRLLAEANNIISQM